MTRAVFLDRDGVINRAVVRDGRPYPPRSVDELEILPGVVAAIARLRAGGFSTIVVTNQPDVARGTETRKGVEAIHQAIASVVPIDQFRVCYHDDADRCSCRKPEPGLLFEAARDGHVDLAGSFMVGDRWRDVEAGRRAGCRTVFIDYSYTESLICEPDIRMPSLADAADWILANAAARKLA